MKNDDDEEIRINATNIFKIYIDDTPKCLKKIYFDLITIFIDLYNREEQNCDLIADFGLKEFSFKYGDVFITGILDNLKIMNNEVE